jgi:hypothetical protein
MAVGIRGFNPIWLLADLVGNLFDDTFYMFVLENTIPYIPATVYHDPELNVPWTNPIQFLANGTLPVNIFFEEDKVYRLEFRQGPTQAYPLIYEVNDYIPGKEIIPDDTTTFPSSNQITNPQFALINFVSPLTITGSDPDPTNLAPGWVLELGGTGTAVITQVPLNDSNINPSNAPYALRFVLTGWNDGEIILRQRFQQNGMLWANKYISGSITTKVGGAFQSLTSRLIDSQDRPLGTILNIPTITDDFTQFPGLALLTGTTNSDTPPDAYIDYQIILPNNSDIYITSIQLIVQDNQAQPAFEQDSINRQIDHTYNAAYPIVPIGGIIDYFGFLSDTSLVPAHYLPCNGAALKRTTYGLLFNVITHIETVTLTSGLATFTIADGTIYPTGWAVEGTGIPPGTTILTIVGTTVTLSANATASGPSAVRFFTTGAGNGTTTFNLPDFRGFYLAGAGSTLLSAYGHGQMGGSKTATLQIANMPAHNHPGSTGTYQVGSGGGGSIPTAANLTPTGTQPVTVTVASQGSGTPFSILPPTILSQKIIRFE